MFEVQFYNDGWFTDSIGDCFEWLKDYMREMFENVPTSFRIVKGNRVHLLLLKGNQVHLLLKRRISKKRRA